MKTTARHDWPVPTACRAAREAQPVAARASIRRALAILPAALRQSSPNSDPEANPHRNPKSEIADEYADQRANGDAETDTGAN